jgi:hypothetical protein
VSSSIVLVFTSGPEGHLIPASVILLIISEVKRNQIMYESRVTYY